MEREVVRTTQEYKGVTFTNVPSYQDTDGNVTFKLIEEMMCEDIALQIPIRLRGSISVDFDTLDYETMLAETKAKHGITRMMTDEQMQTVEKMLIDSIFES